MTRRASSHSSCTRAQPLRGRPQALEVGPLGDRRPGAGRRALEAPAHPAAGGQAVAPLPGPDVHPPGPLQVVEAGRGGRARQVDLGAGEGRVRGSPRPARRAARAGRGRSRRPRRPGRCRPRRAPGACAAGPRRRPRTAPRSRRAAAGGRRSRARGGLCRRSSAARPGSAARPVPGGSGPGWRRRTVLGVPSESRSSSRRPPRRPALVLPAGGAAQPVLAGQVGGAPPAALRAVGGAGPRDLVQAGRRHRRPPAWPSFVSGGGAGRITGAPREPRSS